VPSNLTAPARQALALPDAQHRTWSVTRYSVAEIAQATPHARLRTSSDHQQSARILREASVNMSRIGPMAMLTRAWEIAALCNSSMPRLAASFFADCRRSSKSNSIGRSEPLAGITSTSVRSACTAFAAWLANRELFGESAFKPMAQTHSRCSTGLAQIVSACCVVNTGQSASFNTFAAVEPSSVLRKRPACVGMMLRSNPFVWASCEDCAHAHLARALFSSPSRPLNEVRCPAGTRNQHQRRRSRGLLCHSSFWELSGTSLIAAN